MEVTLNYEDDHVTLTVDNPLGKRDRQRDLGEPDAERADTGAEFATLNGGYGLTGMRERLLLLGGSLNAGVQDGRWVVTAEVPG